MSFRILVNGIERQVDILRRRPHLVVSVDGREHEVPDAGPDGDGLCRFTVSGAPITVARVGTHQGQILRFDNRTYVADLLVDGEDGELGDASSEIRAPMPGAVISVDVAVGTAVKYGDPILTIESMKLQTMLSAPRDGTIAEIHVDIGMAFDKDQVLVRLEELIKEAADA